MTHDQATAASMSSWERATPRGACRALCGIAAASGFLEGVASRAEDRQTVSPMITPAASHPFDHGGLKRPRTDNRRGFCPGSEREEARRLDGVEFGVLEVAGNDNEKERHVGVRRTKRARG